MCRRFFSDPVPIPVGNFAGPARQGLPNRAIKTVLDTWQRTCLLVGGEQIMKWLKNESFPSHDSVTVTIDKNSNFDSIPFQSDNLSRECNEINRDTVEQPKINILSKIYEHKILKNGFDLLSVRCRQILTTLENASYTFVCYIRYGDVAKNEINPATSQRTKTERDTSGPFITSPRSPCCDTVPLAVGVFYLTVTSREVSFPGTAILKFSKKISI